MIKVPQRSIININAMILYHIVSITKIGVRYFQTLDFISYLYISSYIPVIGFNNVTNCTMSLDDILYACKRNKSDAAGITGAC